MKSIRYAGRKRVYDLVNAVPSRNFFANGILVHNCEVLPNSEMGHPEYRERHGIKTVHTPVLHFHATPSDDSYPEQYELVVATKTLSENDWMRSQLFAWAVQAFHCLGLTQSIAVFLHHHKGVSYRKFYEGLLKVAEDHSWFQVGQALTVARSSFTRLRLGTDWGYQNTRFGDIIWPVEEGGFLSCVTTRQRFYLELSEWIEDQYKLGTQLLADLITYQDAVVKAPSQFARQPLLLRYNIHEHLEGCYRNDPIPLIKEDCHYHILAKPYTDLREYAKEVVWYGRKGGKFQNEVIRLPEGKGEVNADV